MPIKHSIHDVSFKALDTDKGEFEAIVSAFGNVDYGGDRVIKGAFANSIKELREKGDPLPLLWSHDWGNPQAHIGKALPEDIEEIDQGLKIKGQLDLDNPFAAQVFRLLKERRVKEFSFGYEIRDERKGKDGANELVDLALIEAGPTLRGMNPSTELLSVKSDLERAAGVVKVKVYGSLDGSIEEAQRKLGDALKEQFGDDDTWVWIVATYTDRLVYSIEKQGGPADYFEVAYTVDGDSVTFDSPVEVELTTEVRQKTDRTGHVLNPISQELVDDLERSVQFLKGLLSHGDSREEESDSSDVQTLDVKSDDDDLASYKARIAADAARS